jgi:hypothetical protein
MQELKLDLLRREFPDYLEVGKVYHWPRVPYANEWEEGSWHNDLCPSWRLETGSGLYIELMADYPSPEDREEPTQARWRLNLMSSDYEYITDVYWGDQMEIVIGETEHLLGVLGGAACR